MDLATLILNWLRTEEWIPEDARERLEALIEAAKH